MVEPEQLSALNPAWAEVAIGALRVCASLAVFVASYRRCRCLSRYPVWRSIPTALLSAMFLEIWLVVWLINHQGITAEWREYRATRAKEPALTL